MRKPDIKGDNANAWRVPKRRASAWAALHPEKVDPVTLMTTVDLWYVNGKGFHPFWSWWAVSAVSLEDIEGVAPANKHYPEAEWELSIWSIGSGEPAVNGDGGFKAMEPPDLLLQFHGLERGQVEGVERLLVEAICAGRTSPDSDWRRQNMSAMVKVVNDYYIGLFGGAARSRKLEVDPFTGRFTGQEDAEQMAWV